MQGYFRHGLVRFDKHSWQLSRFDDRGCVELLPGEKKRRPEVDRRLSNF